MSRKKSHYYSYYFTLPALSIYFIFFILPTFMGFYFSFTNWNIDHINTARFIGFKNFLYLFKNEYFQLASWNTFLFATVTNIFKVIFGLLLALALNRSFITKQYLRTIFYLPGVLSIIVVGIMFSSIFRMKGMLNNILFLVGLKDYALDWLGNRSTALICVMFLEIWKWTGLNMIIFLAGLQAIPIELYESSKIDGASSFEQLKFITLPMLMPAFTITIVLGIIGGLKTFEEVYVLTGGGPGHATEVLNTMVLRAYSEGFYGRGSAMGLLLFLITSIIALTVAMFLRKREIEL